LKIEIKTLATNIQEAKGDLFFKNPILLRFLGHSHFNILYVGGSGKLTLGLALDFLLFGTIPKNPILLRFPQPLSLQIFY
jgi:hypothetical protein